MGAGASTAVPSTLSVEYENLSAEDREKVDADYQKLLSEGKTAEEAIEMLRPKTVVKSVPLTDLLTVVEAAVKNGKTPLVVDNSEDCKVDTFFSYRSAVVIDGKKMGLDKSMRSVPVSEIMESTRSKLVGALKLGYPLVIALTKSVTDFATTFSDEACKSKEDGNGLDFKDGSQSYFPQEVFKGAGRGLLSDEWLNKLFRDEDKKDTSGFAMSRSPETFHVIITSNFAPEDFEEYLFENEWGLPKPKGQYEFIVIKPEE